MSRQAINNLVRNGGFEDAPAFVAPTNTNQRFIDGTAAGSITNDLYQWFYITGGVGSAQFDPSVKYSGHNSIRLDCTTASGGTIGTAIAQTIGVSPSLVNQRLYMIPVLPSTAYTLRCRVKTENISSLNTGGARVRILRYTGASTSSVGNTESSFITGTNDWQLVALSFTTEATARFVNVWLNIFNETGTAWFDDITLDTTTPTTRLTATNRQVVRDIKSALSFDGVNDFVEFPNNTTTQFASNSFSVAVEFKHNSRTASPRLINKFDIRGWLFEISNGSGLRVRLADATNSKDVIVSNVLKNQDWNQAVLTVDQPNNELRIYTNGLLVLTDNLGGVTTMATSASKVIQVGVLGGSGFFAGTIGPTRLWKGTVLSAAEVTSLYTSGTYPASGLILDAPFNEGAGTIVYDTSGNGNDGTITGATYTSDTPSKARKEVNGNLVVNGDFSYVPVVNVATTTTLRWIDGTASGSTTNNLFGWSARSTGGSFAALFDTTEKYNGKPSLRLSTTAVSSFIEAAQYNGSANPTTEIHRSTLIPVLPNTSYTWSFAMKTQNNSGDATNGARLGFVETNGTGTNNTTSASAYIKATTGWTVYTGSFTTSATARFVHTIPLIYGHQGAATLIMDAWFSNIELRPTVPTSRNIA